MATLTQNDLNALNETFEQRTPQELLRWTKEAFGERCGAISAMQKSGSAICHMIHRENLDIRVLFVDTGVSFQETLDTRDAIASQYGLEVVTLHPKQTMQEQTQEFGILYLSPEGQEKCCHMRKTQPLLGLKGHYDALVSSLRRSDGGKRGNTPILAIDPEMNCVRVHPLANVSEEDLEAYIAEHQVIVNPLHDQGYSTISCNRCTTPVMPNEPKRAGRWRHLGPWAAYCGINPTDVDSQAGRSIDLPQDLVDRILGRMTDFSI